MTPSHTCMEVLKAKLNNDAGLDPVMAMASKGMHGFVNNVYRTYYDLLSTPQQESEGFTAIQCDS